MNRLKKLKKIRLHREGTEILIVSAILLTGINGLIFWACQGNLLFYIGWPTDFIIFVGMLDIFRIVKEFLFRFSVVS